MPFNAKHWRERAKEARTMAEQMCDPESRQQMLEIAEGYERLAQHYMAREPKMVDLTPGAGKAETPGEALNEVAPPSRRVRPTDQGS